MLEIYQTILTHMILFTSDKRFSSSCSCGLKLQKGNIKLCIFSLAETNAGNQEHSMLLFTSVEAQNDTNSQTPNLKLQFAVSGISVSICLS